MDACEPRIAIARVPIRHFKARAIDTRVTRTFRNIWKTEEVNRSDFRCYIKKYVASQIIYILYTSTILGSSSNFISRRIQQNTFQMHNILTMISQMYLSGGCQRSSEAHRADYRYFNNRLKQASYITII